MAQFIEYFSIFWFWMGALITLGAILIVADTIIQEVIKSLKKWLRKKLFPSNTKKVDYSYLEDPDYYGD